MGRNFSIASFQRVNIDRNCLNHSNKPRTVSPCNDKCPVFNGILPAVRLFQEQARRTVPLRSRATPRYLFRCNGTLNHQATTLGAGVPRRSRLLRVPSAGSSCLPLFGAGRDGQRLLDVSEAKCASYAWSCAFAGPRSAGVGVETGASCDELESYSFCRPTRTV